mmetsp:Transcript_25389/g.73213  ORF Transcript_25389/g.73213 Transcript_25389/m.73213 type:complete len:220 (-) Transcript_25389:802-1461(-)
MPCVLSPHEARNGAVGPGEGPEGEDCQGRNVHERARHGADAKRAPALLWRVGMRQNHGRRPVARLQQRGRHRTQCRRHEPSQEPEPRLRGHETPGAEEEAVEVGRGQRLLEARHAGQQPAPGVESVVPVVRQEEGVGQGIAPQHQGAESSGRAGAERPRTAEGPERGQLGERGAWAHEAPERGGGSQEVAELRPVGARLVHSLVAERHGAAPERMAQQQ